MLLCFCFLIELIRHCGEIRNFGSGNVMRFYDGIIIGLLILSGRPISFLQNLTCLTFIFFLNYSSNNGYIYPYGMYVGV